MSTWFSTAGGSSNIAYHYPDIRAFHAAVVRAYHQMRKSLYCAQVILPPEFGGCFVPLRYTVWCCYTPDNIAPRLVCGDREMILRVVAPNVIGVDERRHGGGWFTRDLVYSFVAGCGDDAAHIPDEHILCKCALGKVCGGRRPDERYLMRADLARSSVYDEDGHRDDDRTIGRRSRFSRRLAVAPTDVLSTAGASAQSLCASDADCSAFDAFDASEFAHVIPCADEVPDQAPSAATVSHGASCSSPLSM